jgi:hypothetical protein
MKKMIFKILTMCVFALGLNTQANAQTLKPLMPEKTGLENMTTDEFIDHCANKYNENELLYYVGGQLMWSAKNTKISPTQSVYDAMKDARLDYYFGDREAILAMLAYLERGGEPLTGQVKTAGINSTGAVKPLTRDAYSFELPFTYDWNAVEDMSGMSFLGADVDPVNVFSAKCGNPLYPARVGGGYARVNRNNEGYAQMPPSTGAEKYPDSEFGQVETNPGNTYITNHNYYDQEKVSYEQDEEVYYEKPKVQFQFSVGILFGARDGCWGHNAGQCGHGYGYQQFGYQPQAYNNQPVQPVVTNTDVYVNVINNITNTNTATATTNPGNPPGNPGPADPSNGDDPKYPIDPHNRPSKGVKVNQNEGLANNSDPRPMNPAAVSPKPDVSVKGSRSNPGSDPIKFGPKFNPALGSEVLIAEQPKPQTENPNLNLRPSTDVPRSESRHVPAQDQPNQFTRQARPEYSQARVDGPTKQQTQESRENYKQNSRGSSVDQRRGPGVTQSPRQGYSDSGPSRSTVYNSGQTSRGSAPTGGRANSGGGNSGGRNR